MGFNLEQIGVAIVAVIAIIVVFKFMKGCIKAVISLVIVLVAAAMIYKAGGIETVTNNVLNYVEYQSLEDDISK